MKKGTYISKATYQKLSEENKKLLSDIRLLVDENMTFMPDQIFCKMKWRKKFKEEKLLCNMLKDYADKHPLKKK